MIQSVFRIRIDLITVGSVLISMRIRIRIPKAHPDPDPGYRSQFNKDPHGSRSGSETLDPGTNYLSVSRFDYI